MKTPCIWFNKHLSNTWEVIALLDDARRAGEFRVVCSHPRRQYGDLLRCDRFEREPEGLGDDDYVRYCLDFVRRHEVDVFFPGRKLHAIVRQRERFQAVGVKVVGAGSVNALSLLTSKSGVYRAETELGLLVPDYEIVNDLVGFDAAWERLHAQHELLCFKPDTGVFGLGFFVIGEHGSTSIKHEPHNIIGHDDARRRLARRGQFRDLMLMQYLPGPERSVDCLAKDGELLRCVVRHKMQGGQMLEAHPDIEDAVRRLTKRFGLTNLFNVQFRDAAGKHYLLEINPRMSGGLPFSCQSGVLFPLWAIRLALGTATANEIPQPRVGIWVPQPEFVSSL